MLVRIGGGNQSFEETSKFRKTGKPIIEYEIQVREWSS